MSYTILAMSRQHSSPSRTRHDAIRVQVALGRVDVRDTEVAGALRAVVGLVVLVARAAVLGAARAVAGARVRALASS